MVQISVRLSLRERGYMDSLIKRGLFGSYGQSLRSLLYWYKIDQREIGKLRTQNAKLKRELELYECGRLEQETQPSDMGGSEGTNTG